MATSEDEERSRYTPEYIKQQMAAGSISAKQARVALKLKAARATRDMEAPGMVHSRGQSIAASPLSHIARGLRQYKAGKDIRDLEGEQVGLDEEEALASEEYFKGADAVERGGMYQGNDVTTFGMGVDPQQAGGEFFEGSQPAQPAPPTPEGPPMQMWQPPATEMATQAPPQPSPQIGQPDPNLNPDPYAGSSVSVGDIPPGMSPQEMEAVKKWLATQQGGGGGGGAGAMQQYAQQLRQQGQVPQGGQGVY